MSAGPNTAAAPEAQTALAAQPARTRDWQSVAALRVPVAVELPLRAFCVRDLLQLRPGTILRSSYRSSDALPLRARDQVLASVDFEVTGGQLHARITELA